MAPKKGKASPLSVWLDNTDTTEFSRAADIPAYELSNAYGLASPRHCKPGSAGLTAKPPSGSKRKRVTADTDEEDSALSKKNGKQTTLKFTSENQCNEENCSRDPHCLAWMGAEKWEDEKKAFKKYANAAGLPEDPRDSSRDPTKPVGLRNLGATCYANSYLQVWFQHLQFRAAVFKCPVSPSQKLEDSPLFQLQTTFAALQQGATSVFNPKPLVKSLRLQEGEQQDSAEFGKLFLGLLDYEFKKQQDPSLATLVQDLFEGTLVYGTQCHSCGNRSERTNTYLELEINLKPKCDLENQIQAMLAEEKLSGDNKYQCGACEQLVDATRYVKIESLPTVLHFSLLRFVFDEKTFDRKKVNHFVHFPVSIDMSAYVSPSSTNGQNSDDMIYDLKGVLLHKGTSAHHGHYIAWVWDQQRQNCFVCDDESVEIQEKFESPEDAKSRGRDSTAPIILDVSDDDDDLTERGSGKGSDSGKSDTARPLRIRDKDAYMLIYARRSSVPESADAKDPEPPSAAKAKLGELEEELEKEVKEYEARRKEVETDFDAARALRLQLSQVWKTGNQEPGCFVSSKSLKDWMIGDLQKPDKKKEEAEKAAELPSPPVASTSAHTLDGPDAIMANGKTSELNGSVSSTNGKGKQRAVDSSFLVCSHGRLAPEKVVLSKKISEEAALLLEGCGAIEKPLLHSSDILCADCIWAKALGSNYLDDHKRDLKAFKDRENKKDFSRNFWISKEWLADWKNPIPRMHQEDLGTDPAPNSTDYYSHVHCLHGKLQPSFGNRTKISSGARDVLKQRFPTWRTFTETEPKCYECSPSSHSDEELRSMASIEKTALKHWLSRETASLDNLVAGELYYAVPFLWLRSWKSWVKAPTKNDRPGRIDFTDIVCEHSLLNIDFNNSLMRERYAFLLGKEWASVKKSYGCNCEIQVGITTNFSAYQSIPQSCECCMELKRKDYQKATIALRRLKEKDLTEDRQRIPVEVSLIEKEEPATHASGRPKRSTRSSEKPPVKDWMKCDIEKFDSIKNIKMCITAETKCPILYLRVYHQDRELDNDETMDSLGIADGETLYYYEDEVNDAVVDLTKLEELCSKEDRRSAKKKRVAREEGFHQTGLHGYDTGRSSSNTTPGPEVADIEMEALVEPEPEMILNALERHCPSCTFLNATDAEKCGMCDSAF